jgi:hypothetical protein
MFNCLLMCVCVQSSQPDSLWRDKKRKKKKKKSMLNADELDACRVRLRACTLLSVGLSVFWLVVCMYYILLRLPPPVVCIQTSQSVTQKRKQTKQNTVQTKKKKKSHKTDGSMIDEVRHLLI